MPAEPTLTEQPCCLRLDRLTTRFNDHKDEYDKDVPEVWKAIDDIRLKMWGVLISSVVGALGLVGVLVVLLLKK